MDLSVILCTYNRARQLRQTLATFRQLDLPPALTWELIVVDNNSTDHTAAACERVRHFLPLRYVTEPQQGHSIARNRGVREGLGGLLVFTDDDVDVTPDWLGELWACAQRHPEATMFGGKILPRWEGTPPWWMHDHLDLLPGITMEVDWGHEERLLDVAREKFTGANMAFRRRVFDEVGGFRADLGLNGHSQVRCDEHELMDRLAALGHQAVYTPTALVYHRNAAERMTERYVRQWYIGAGIAAARLGATGTPAHQWFGAPRYLWRRLIENALTYAAHRWTGDVRVWLPAEIQMARTWGMIKECRRTNAEC